MDNLPSDFSLNLINNIRTKTNLVPQSKPTRRKDHWTWFTSGSCSSFYKICIICSPVWRWHVRFLVYNWILEQRPNCAGRSTNSTLFETIEVISNEKTKKDSPVVLPRVNPAGTIKQSVLLNPPLSGAPKMIQNEDWDISFVFDRVSVGHAQYKNFQHPKVYKLNKLLNFVHLRRFWNSPGLKYALRTNLTKRLMFCPNSLSFESFLNFCFLDWFAPEFNKLSLRVAPFLLFFFFLL
jgi:hypothetical protein